MRRREGAMLRKEEARNRRSQAQRVIVVTRRVPMTRGATLRSRVKGNFQARFWNSGGRGDSPTDCRKFEFIPLSFWYDAPLTSPYRDRRHDPWQVYGSPTYSPAQ